MARVTALIALALALSGCADAVDVDLTRMEPGVVHRIADVEQFEVRPVDVASPLSNYDRTRMMFVHPPH